MKYYCTKCNCGYAPDKFEKRAGMMLYRCDKCHQVIVVLDEKDFESVSQFLLSDSEIDYMIHLVRKQKDKVAKAFKQLDVTEQKLIIQQELMKELK